MVINLVLSVVSESQPWWRGFSEKPFSVRGGGSSERPGDGLYKG